MARPLIESAIEVTGIDGKAKKYGLHLLRLDTDHWKAVVHERLSFDRDAPGALRLNDAADDDYCQQLVAEARVKGPSGRWIWVSRYRENHFLDCEAMAAAAAWRVGSDRQRAEKKDSNPSMPRRTDPPDLEAAPQARAQEPVVATVVAQQAVRARFASFAQRLNR